MDTIESLINKEPYWTQEYESLLRNPYEHLASKPGKNFRALLIHTFNSFYRLPSEKVSLISEFVEILHTSSLLIDDIEDNSQWRRGIKASHLLYGVPLTINTANYMYFYAMQCLQKLANNGEEHLLNKFLIIFNQEMMNLHRGQGLDIYWRDQCETPDEASYINMVMNKTGGLFRLTVKIMEVFCDDSPEFHSLVPLSNLLGILYQIRDDYMNLQDPKMIENKGFAEDISEGKFSFPIVHAVRYGSENNDTFVLEVLRERTQDDELKRNVVDYLEKKSKSLEYTRTKIREVGTLIKEKYIPKVDNEGSVELHKIVTYLCDI